MKLPLATLLLSLIFLLNASAVKKDIHPEYIAGKDTLLDAFKVLVPTFELEGKTFWHFATDCNEDVFQKSWELSPGISKFLKVDRGMTHGIGRFSLDKNYEAIITETIIGYCGTTVELRVYDKKKRAIQPGTPLVLADLYPAGDFAYSESGFTPQAQDAYIGKVYRGDGLFCVIVKNEWHCPPPSQGGISNCELEEKPAEIFQWVAREGEFPTWLSLLSPGFDRSRFPVATRAF